MRELLLVVAVLVGLWCTTLLGWMLAGCSNPLPLDPELCQEYVAAIDQRTVECGQPAPPPEHAQQLCANARIVNMSEVYDHCIPQVRMLPCDALARPEDWWCSAIVR